MISTVIALPYELARLPLALLDSSLSLLPETSAPRVTVGRAIGYSDKLAGAMLGNPGIATRGSERIERSRKLLLADELEQQAATRREQARDTADAGRRQAAQQRTAAQKTAASGLKAADAAEARGKQEAKATATRTAAAKKAAATRKANARTEKVEQAKARADSAADAKKKAAQRAAKSELDGARETKQAATKARADADRLSDLTEAKKAERKSS